MKEYITAIIVLFSIGSCVSFGAYIDYNDTAFEEDILKVEKEIAKIPNKNSCEKMNAYFVLLDRAEKEAFTYSKEDEMYGRVIKHFFACHNKNRENFDKLEHNLKHKFNEVYTEVWRKIERQKTKEREERKKRVEAQRKKERDRKRNRKREACQRICETAVRMSVRHIHSLSGGFAFCHTQRDGSYGADIKFSAKNGFGMEIKHLAICRVDRNGKIIRFNTYIR